LDFVEEISSKAKQKEAAIEQNIGVQHDQKLIKREFDVGDLALAKSEGP